MFKHISIEQTRQRLASGEELVIVDIRDPNSYATGHINGSFNLNNDNVTDFVRDADLDKPVVVVCYHGHSSQGAAQYLVNQGFEEVYSMDGGFEGWKKS